MTSALCTAVGPIELLDWSHRRWPNDYGLAMLRLLPMSDRAKDAEILAWGCLEPAARRRPPASAANANRGP